MANMTTENLVENAKNEVMVECTKQKPIEEIVTGNHNQRFSPIYKCYCPKCNRLLKRDSDKCSCEQEIDWSDWC